VTRFCYFYSISRQPAFFEILYCQLQKSKTRFMKLRLSFSFLILILFHFLISAQTIKRINGSLLSADSLSGRVSYLMDTTHTSGIAISVFNNNQPVYSKAFGMADIPNKISLAENSELYGASLSKMVFAYVVMQLVQEKIIDLDKPLVEYLPKDLTDYLIAGYGKGYQDLKGDTRYEKITARMCLTHTTGFPNWRWFETGQKLKIKFDPGTRYSYSGEGLYLLQFVIEQITGKGYETICQERVFQPLGMNGTSMVWQSNFEKNICYGYTADGKPVNVKRKKDANCAGSMTTTPADFTKFYTAFINHKGLSKQSFTAMTSTQVHIKSIKQFGPLAIIDSTLNDDIQLGYGLGVGVFRTPYGRAFFKEGHDDGWAHYTVCYPEKKIAIVILTNSDYGESTFKELLAYAIGDVYTPWKWENYIPYDNTGDIGK
jgi:D-alanyl-D-alanine-carboxypeptidase/D-alanyl-D-alanine-endopeptidase